MKIIKQILSVSFLLTTSLCGFCQTVMADSHDSNHKVFIKGTLNMKETLSSLECTDFSAVPNKCSTSWEKGQTTQYLFKISCPFSDVAFACYVVNENFVNRIFGYKLNNNEITYSLKLPPGEYFFEANHNLDTGNIDAILK